MYLNIGIDVAKNVHEACLVNENGEQIGKFIQLKKFKEKHREIHNDDKK